MSYQDANGWHVLPAQGLTATAASGALRTGPGVFWRVHPKGRSWEVGAGSSKVNWAETGMPDALTRESQGYSCFANPMHLWRYVMEMAWDVDDVQVVGFTGQITGEGWDGEPTVTPDSQPFDRMTWEEFDSRLNSTDVPSTGWMEGTVTWTNGYKFATAGGGFTVTLFPETLSGYKAHIYCEDIGQVETAWNRIKMDAEIDGWGVKLASAMTLESWRGTHQWGKGVTVYFPRRATWESDLAHLVRLMAGRPENVQKPVQGETYAGNGVSWRYEFHGDPGHDIDPGEVNRWYKAAALDNEARISVAEHVMENFGYDGEWWPVKEGHTDDPSYNEQMEPLRAFVAKVCGERVRTHVSNYMLDQAGNAQAMLTPVGTLVVRPGVSTMTVLHECAHYINRSTHGQGHDDAFIQIAADLYGRYIGADAKAKFLDLSVAPLGDRISSAAAIEANPVGTTFEHNNNTMEIIPFSDGVTWYLYVWDSPDVEGGMKYDIGYAKLKNGVLDEIKIDDAYRREGLATKLVDHIRAQVGGIGFHTDPGEYTPAGAAFTETVGRPSLDDGPPSAVWNPLSASISGSDDEFVFHL